MMFETFTYRVVQGLPIKLDLYRPVNTRPAPIIVWIHGGALIGGSRGWTQPVVRDLLAELGYAQVSIDYRFAPESKLPDIIDDVAEAFRWIHESLPFQCAVDTGRIGVIGGSAGGYLTVMTGCMDVPRPQALVSLYGYGDIVGPWYSEPDPFYLQQPKVTEEEARAAVGSVPISEQLSGGPDRFRFYLWCRQNGFWPREIMGIDPKLQPEAFVPFCPERNVGSDYPPTLLIHGNADTDVPYDRSVDMAAALAKAGIAHELITIEGGPHGFDGRLKTHDWAEKQGTPEGRALSRAVEWFGQWLGVGPP
ncbi:MAG TPA: alpha/beta hydrolase [Candidatus Hydrogenedentes bacterium]|nr:alpha/beta hydrolase [Candidatus Hydrogenedentota bacterium]